MGRTRSNPTPGNVVEVPLGSCNAYLLVLRDTAIGVFASCYLGRPSVATLTDAGIVEVVYVSGTKIENGEWPVIGQSERMVENDWWPPAVRYPLPSDPRRFMVVERGHLRPATEADGNLPLQIKLNEESLLDRLRNRFHCNERCKEPLQQVQSPQIKPVETAMSVHKNDVADRVRLVFDEALSKYESADSALSATQTFFREDLMDEEFAVPFWLALADMALAHGCLTIDVASRTRGVIESGKCFQAIESWNPESQRPEASELRHAAISKLLMRLDGAPFS